VSRKISEEGGKKSSLFEVEVRVTLFQLNKKFIELQQVGRFEPSERQFFERIGCSLDLFCLLFCVKTKKEVGFGATPQWQCGTALDEGVKTKGFKESRIC
jgi:hypothetical protein